MHPIIIIFLFIYALLPHASFAQQGLSAEKSFGDSNSTLQISQYSSLSYENKTGILTATGDKVRVESNNDVFEFEEGVFNTKDKTGEIHNGVLFLKENNLHIRGEVIQKSAKDTYRIKRFQLTTCDNEAPDWSITGSEINVVKEGYGKIKGAAFRIKDFPVFYLPYMIFPAKTERQTGLLLPQSGYSSLNGVEIELPFFWAISGHADATLYERYMSERGVMQGLEFRYLAGQKSNGEFLFDILRDKIEVKDLTDIDQAYVSPFERTNQNRYWLRGRLDQDLTNGLTARADLDLVSDQDYLREFEGDLVGIDERPDLKEDFGRPLEERYSSFRRSALRVSRDGEDYSLQGSGYYYQQFDSLTGAESYQPLAGAFYSLLPTRLLSLPLFFNLDTDYNYMQQENDIKGHSMSVNPEISYPTQLGDYLKLDSSLGYTGLFESDDTLSGNNSRGFKEAYQAKVALFTVVERIFAFNQTGVTKVKHKVTPTLTYEYGKYGSLPEDQDEDLWFDPILPGTTINRIGLSLENLVDASLRNEKGDVSYSQWVRFDITQRYDLEELQDKDELETDKKPWEPLLATLVLRPLKDLNLRANAAWDHYENRVSSAVVSLNLAARRSENRADRYYIDYVKDTSDSDSLRLRAEVGIFEGLSAGVSLRRNLDLHYEINNSFWLQYQAQCWSIKLGMERERANKSLILKFRLSGF